MYIISTKNQLEFEDNFLFKTSQNGEVLYFYSFDDKKQSERIFSKIKKFSTLYESKDGKIKKLSSGLKKFIL